MAGAKVKIAGGLEDLDNSTAQAERYSEYQQQASQRADEKEKAQKEKEISDAAAQKGYRTTKNKNYFYDEKTKTHYRWDPSKKDFVARPDIKYIGADGSFTKKLNNGKAYSEIDKDGKEISRGAEKQYAPDDHENAAKDCGLKKTPDGYYDETNKMYYRWHRDTRLFYPEPSIKMKHQTMDLLNKSGYAKTNNPDYVVKKDKDGNMVHYKWDSQRNNFVKVPDLCIIYEDGSAEYNIQNGKGRRQVNADGVEIGRKSASPNKLKTIGAEASDCGLKRSGGGTNLFYDETVDAIYTYDSTKRSFIANKEIVSENGNKLIKKGSKLITCDKDGKTLMLKSCFGTNKEEAAKDCGLKLVEKNIYQDDTGKKYEWNIGKYAFIPKE